MALNPEVESLLEQDIVQNHKRAMIRTTTMSSVQTAQLNTIADNLIHQHGAVTDDASLIAGLNTAAGSPRQGAANRPA